MSEPLQAVKGMNDLLPPDSAKWNHVEARARAAFERFGYREIRTPIIEYTPVFVRIGDATEVVEKQMYTFDDRDGRSVSMRPEGTASVVRAYLEHSVGKTESVTRYFYSGPMFRHERQQKGRYRQFYQMGCESFGETSPTADAELVAMLVTLFGELGIAPLEVLVNSVGGPEDRPAYRAALVAYFTPHIDQLCEDCKRRLERNPLRILDCKVPGCARLAAGAPSILDHLGPASKAHYDGFLAALDALGVAYRVDPRLVRGLDYYTGPTFEINKVGESGALCGGGRYDQLVEDFGGPATPAVGFAFGVERVVAAMPGDAASFDPAADVYLAAAQGAAARRACLQLAQRLRGAGYRVDLDHRDASLKAQFKRADKLRARAVIVIGDVELGKGEVTLRNMATKEQRTISAATLDDELRTLLGR